MCGGGDTSAYLSSSVPQPSYQASPICVWGGGGGGGTLLCICRAASLSLGFLHMGGGGGHFCVSVRQRPPALLSGTSVYQFCLVGEFLAYVKYCSIPKFSYQTRHIWDGTIVYQFSCVYQLMFYIYLSSVI